MVSGTGVVALRYVIIYRKIHNSAKLLSYYETNFL